MWRKRKKIKLQLELRDVLRQVLPTKVIKLIRHSKDLNKLSINIFQPNRKWLSFCEIIAFKVEVQFWKLYIYFTDIYKFNRILTFIHQISDNEKIEFNKRVVKIDIWINFEHDYLKKWMSFLVAWNIFKFTMLISFEWCIHIITFIVKLWYDVNWKWPNTFKIFI